jgi:hypothetical protein
VRCTAAVDPQLPIVLGSTSVESTPVFETKVPFGQLSARGFPDDARKTGARVKAAEGFKVGLEPDPYGPHE